MPPEKILENINQAIMLLSDSKDPESLSATTHLETAKSGLEENLRTVNNKRTGGLCRTKAAEKILKSAKRKDMAGYWKEGGKQCICDGIRAYRFANALDLPILQNKKPPDLTKCFLPLSQYCEVTEVPRPKLIRAENKIFRTGLHRDEKHDGIWCLRSDREEFYLNAIYLAEALEVMGAGAKLYLPKSKTAPLYFTAEDGSDGFLFPMLYPELNAEAILNSIQQPMRKYQ